MSLNNKGFSLIEVVVTVALLAIISGIAIPQYSKYKEVAAFQGIGVDLQTVRKQFGVCMAVNQFHDSCDSQTELDINITGLTNIGSDGDNFCADIRKPVRGENVKSCIEVAVTTGIVSRQTSNQKVCYRESGTTQSSPACTASGYDSCDILEWDKGTCTSATACGTSGYYCEDETGECNTSAGTCS